MDLTGPLRTYGEQMAAELDDICGYIFMQKSPSCGLNGSRFIRPTATRPCMAGVGHLPSARCARTCP
jgi:uncharacterized protein YbbK (DUF523 family)